MLGPVKKKGSGGVSEHNLLQNIQGGSAQENEYFHLTDSETQGLQALLANIPHPKYDAPTLSISISPNASILELGSAFAHKITGTFTKKDAGDITARRIKRGNTVVSNAASHDDTSTVQETNSFTAEVDYAQGPIKNNDIGNPDPVGRIQAGTRTASLSVDGIIPWFYRIFDSAPDLDNIDLSTFTKVVGLSTGTVKINQKITNKFVVFVIPNDSTTKTKWFSTDLNSGPIGPGNVMNAPVAKTFSSPNNFWLNEQFKVYATAYASDFNPSLELRNS